MRKEQFVNNHASSPLSADVNGAAIERPLPSSGTALFGSDAIAESLRDIGVPYVALNPGASYRGLHDSLVNHLGNAAPQMLLCLHEEHAIAICQGYAKVTGKPLAAVVHSNVGLMHGTMAIFNAWCDRMPVIVLGATGPVDAAKRRPWIDWLHTARDQGALVRGYVKYDDQPASAAAAREALYRAAWIAQTAPCGPVYVNLDAEMQEAPLAGPLPPVTPSRFMTPVMQGPSAASVAKIAGLLNDARRPLILMGRLSRELENWDQRLQLAEAIQARVATDLKIGASFPTDHPSHICPPGVFAPTEVIEAVRQADVILSLDWVDLGGLLRVAGEASPLTGKVIQVSLDHVNHNGWSMDHQAHPPADLFVAADPDLTVAALLPLVRRGDFAPSSYEKKREPLDLVAQDEKISADMLTVATRRAVGDKTVCLLHVPLSWNSSLWHFRHPLDFIGGDGGGGIGGGPGIAVGAALALKGSGRLPLAIVGDGDFLMGVTALWTAAHYRIPALFIVCNNRSFYNDEVHQERMARTRGRPVENKWIGQRMSDPEVNLAVIAEAQGAVGFGPVWDPAELPGILEKAIAAAEGGALVVVDVRVEPGYTPTMTSGLTREVSSTG